MKNLKKLIITLGITTALITGNTALAEGIGYIDTEKIYTGYDAIQTAMQEISQKELALQEYLLQQEKKAKNLTTPIQKKNFEEQVAKEFKAKKEAYLKFKQDKEKAIYDKIQKASREVLVEQKLDAIVDARVIFVGGIDVSDLVIAKLKKGAK
ncbi:OmpH family outer membrane protein [bacterium]|nr:OmpH family outer membrane protein [bacterium]